MIIMTVILLLLAACTGGGLSDGDYPLPEETPIPTPTPTPTPTPALPLPANPPPVLIPGRVQATPEPEPAALIPQPSEALTVPVNRRTISAGKSFSTVITEDGGMWMWGALPMPDGFTFFFHVFYAVLDGTLFLWDAAGNAFIPDPNMMSGDGTHYFLFCAETGVQRNINTLRIEDAEGNPFTLNDMPQMALINAFLVPGQVAENAFSVYVDIIHSSVYMIDEAGTLYWVAFNHNVEDVHPMEENVADFMTVQFSRNIGPGPLNNTRYFSAVLHTDGSFYLDGDPDGRTRLVDANIIAMDYGTTHALFLAYNNQLWAMGSGSAVGIPNHIGAAPPAWVMDGVVQIAAGSVHSVALTEEGRLYTWGMNTRGQLGTGDFTNQVRPAFIMDNVVAISAGDLFTMAITADGNLWGWGCNRYGQIGNPALVTFAPMLIMEDVVAVSAGYGHTLALTSDGTLWAWGNNVNGQLGDGTRNNSREPIMVMKGVKLP